MSCKECGGNCDELSEEEIEFHIKQLEKVEHLLTVLDDQLDYFCSPEERLSVIEHVAKMIQMDPDVLDIWQAVISEIKEKGVLQ